MLPLKPPHDDNGLDNEGVRHPRLLSEIFLFRAENLLSISTQIFSSPMLTKCKVLCWSYNAIKTVLQPHEHRSTFDCTFLGFYCKQFSIKQDNFQQADKHLHTRQLLMSSLILLKRICIIQSPSICSLHTKTIWQTNYNFKMITSILTVQYPPAKVDKAVEITNNINLENETDHALLFRKQFHFQ